MTVFDGVGTVTASYKTDDSVEKQTFNITKQEVEKFFRGFDEIAILRESKLGTETVDTETHHIFIVVDRERYGDRGASYGVPKAKANEEFRTWLSTIDRKPQANK